MIKQFVQRLEYRFDFAEVANPTRMRVNRTADVESYSKRMAV